MRITCLHTAESNIAVFDSAAKELGIALDVLRHEVRADLLASAEHAGGLTPAISSATQLELLSLARHADVVILTCSTLGPAVEGAATNTHSPILRADEALASAAVTACPAGGKIVALCAVDTTIEPTSRLFFQAAEGSKATVEVQLVSGAWALFKRGDLDGYLATIAKAADLAYLGGASLVALAQASMSGAAPLVTAGPPPLTSAMAGLKAGLEHGKFHRRG